MTEDELFVAVDAVREELFLAKKQFKSADFIIEGLNKAYDKNQMIKKSLWEALRHLSGSPVVSLTEYASLKSGIKVTNQKLIEIQSKRLESQGIRSRAEADVPSLEHQLADLEKRLETYTRPRIVLEFKRNDKR